MRNFLKIAFLPVFLLMFGYAAGQLVFGDTITRPYGTPDYAGGAKAVGPKVNAEFQSIVDWLNGGNIDTDNIAAGGVATVNIADAAITVAKLGLSNGIFSTSSGAFSSGSGFPVPLAVTGLSTALAVQSSNHFVTVSLEPSPTQNLSSGSFTYTSYISAASTNARSQALFVVRDSSTVAHWLLPQQAPGAGYTPCSGFRFTDTPGSGSHTYTFYVSATTSAEAISVFNCRILVREEM